MSLEPQIENEPLGLPLKSRKYNCTIGEIRSRVHCETRLLCMTMTSYFLWCLQYHRRWLRIADQRFPARNCDVQHTVSYAQPDSCCATRDLHGKALESASDLKSTPPEDFLSKGT
jgi:hypothetical protein